MIIKKITTIFFLISFLSTNCFCQIESHVNEIKNFVKHIDSLKNMYDSLNYALTDSAEIKLKCLSLNEGIGEDEYYEFSGDTPKIIGGYSVYRFEKKGGDTIFRINYEGSRHSTYVTQDYYYKNNKLVYAKMLVRIWEDQRNKPFETEEYYQNNKVINVKNKNTLPKTKDKILIVKSLYREGMRYLNYYINNNYQLKK
jgi:hypothetical protein